jgi:hypothetical protein
MPDDGGCLIQSAHSKLPIIPLRFQKTDFGSQSPIIRIHNFDFVPDQSRRSLVL